MPVTVRKMPNTWMALGLAAHFVAGNETFGGFPASELIRTLEGQIRRGHYLFALDTSTDPGRVVGYFGWALYDDAEAERFAASGAPPARERADGGSVLWILTAAATSRAAFFALVRATRALYPTHRVMAVRHKTGGRRIVFDQSRARVMARARGAC